MDPAAARKLAGIFDSVYTDLQKRTEQQLRELIAEVKELTRVAHLHEVRLGKPDGRVLEMEFRDKASACLGPVMRRTRVVPVGDLGDDLEGVLSEIEWVDLTRADVILKGRALLQGQRQEVYAVVEVSVPLGDEDVGRAARRAALLRKKGWRTLAAAAGEKAEARLIETAARAGVAVLQDGQQYNWKEALAAA